MLGREKIGSEVIAKCQCGYEATSLIGGGMMNYETTCYFPCFCKNCHNVVQVNLLSKRKRCPKCKSTKIIPCDDPSLSDNTGKHEVTSWNAKDKLGRELKLTDGNYKCPKCGQMTLHFEDGGLLWD